MSKLMIEDGAPQGLFLTQEERQEGRKITLSKARKDSQTPIMVKTEEAPIDRTSQRWDPGKCQWVNETVETTMISLITNTRGNTNMDATLFATMNGPQLVATYNQMALSALGIELNAKPVQRFSTTEAGIKRCEALASSINARKSGLKQADNPKSEDKVMAKKVKAKKAPIKAKAKKTKTNGAADPNQEKISVEFGCRVGTNREKLLLALHSEYRKPVLVSKLLKPVYGSANEENRSKLTMVIKGLELMITEGRLPYKLTKENRGNEATIALQPAK